MKAYWNDEGRYGDVGHKKREIVDLFRVARLVEPGVTIAEPAAGGVIQRASSVFDNLFMRRGDVQQLVFDAFLEATGYFRVEVRRSLLPVFWPSVIAKLPGDLLAYVGLRGRRVATAVRVADGVGWIVAVAAGLVTVWKAFG